MTDSLKILGASVISDFNLCDRDITHFLFEIPERPTCSHERLTSGSPSYVVSRMAHLAVLSSLFPGLLSTRLDDACHISIQTR
jgi:hypothetical protein